MLSRRCPLWVNCRSSTITASPHHRRLGFKLLCNVTRVSGTEAVARSRSRSSSCRAVPRCLPAWKSFAAGSRRDTAVIVWKQYVTVHYREEGFWRVTDSQRLLLYGETLFITFNTEEDLRGNTAKLVDRRVRLAILSAKPFNTLQWEKVTTVPGRL